MKKVLKKINKIKGLKKIKKAVKKAIHIEYHADPTKIQQKPHDIPKGYVNIVMKSGHCILNGKKPTKSICGNKKTLAWKLIPVGVNEYQIRADNGNLLTNKNGLNKIGNEIIAIKQQKPERDLSNIWNLKAIKNGEYIILNAGTNKCLDTTNKTNEGSGFKLENCKSFSTLNNQLFSFDEITPEYLSKIKSDPELLKLGKHWVQMIGADKLCLKSTGEGSPLEQSRCQDNEMQLWRIIPIGENQYSLQNKAGFKISIRNQAKIVKGIISNHLTLNTERFSIINKQFGRFIIKNNSVDKCIDIDGKPKESGNYLMFKCKENEEGQTFKFVKPTTINLPKSWVNIVGPNFLCLKNDGKEEKLTQVQCDNKPEMLWKFEITEGNTVTIVNKEDQSMIDLLNSKTFKGNSLVAFKRNNSKSQEWDVQQLKKGKISLRNKASGTCLDVPKIGKESNYRIWECSKKNKNQKFRLQYARPAPPEKVKIVYRIKKSKTVKKPKITGKRISKKVKRTKKTSPTIPKQTNIQSINFEKKEEKKNTPAPKRKRLPKAKKVKRTKKISPTIPKQTNIKPINFEKKEEKTITPAPKRKRLPKAKKEKRTKKFSPSIPKNTNIQSINFENKEEETNIEAPKRKRLPKAKKVKRTKITSPTIPNNTNIQSINYENKNEIPNDTNIQSINYIRAPKDRS